MARFDVYRHPDAKQRVTTPFLLDVQNEDISGLQTRVVLPLRRAERVAIPLRGLNPALDVEGPADETRPAVDIRTAEWTPDDSERTRAKLRSFTRRFALAGFELAREPNRFRLACAAPASRPR